MGELATKEVDLREATIALLRHLGIESGLWNLTVKLGFGTISVASSPEDPTPLPAAIVTIMKLGLQATAPQTANATTVDAADPQREVKKEEGAKKEG